MSINLKLPSLTELRPRITVIGVGGAGGNAVNNMIQYGLEGVEFIAANTDAQALSMSAAGCRVQMGATITEGLGAGSKPDVGAAAAEEAIDELRALIEGAHMLFITAGMGGGTGTGAAPVIARAAKEMGILTVGVVTKPFEFEGQRRMRVANDGIVNLAEFVDTLIVIPNQNLFRIANEKTTFADAFQKADDVLKSGVSCITDLMVKEGLINLDFADVRVVMQSMGTALMGTGEAEGEQRALRAAEIGDLQSAARRSVDARRQGSADQHHRQLRHDALRGRGSRLARAPRSRPGSQSRYQHHRRRDLRPFDRGPHPRLRGGDRHQCRPAAACRQGGGSGQEQPADGANRRRQPARPEREQAAGARATTIRRRAGRAPATSPSSRARRNIL